MPLSFHQLASKIIAESEHFAFEYELDFEIEELLEWLYFKGENVDLNAGLEIHEYSDVPVKGRGEPVLLKQEINGDYLLFDFIGHQPLYLLRSFKTKTDLVWEIVTAGGLFNDFTTVQLPIINGEALHVRTLAEKKKSKTDIVYVGVLERVASDGIEDVLKVQVKKALLEKEQLYIKQVEEICQLFDITLIIT